MFLCFVVVVVFQVDHFRFRLRFGNFFLWHFRNGLMSPGFDTFLQICCDLAWLNQGFRKRYDSINLRHQIWTFICFEKRPLIKQQHSLSNSAFRLPVLKCLLSNLWPLNWPFWPLILSIGHTCFYSLGLDMLDDNFTIVFPIFWNIVLCWFVNWLRI